MLQLTWDLHKKAWTRIIRGVQKLIGCKRTTFTRSCRAARSSQAVHTGFQGQGWHQSCTDTDAGKCHNSCSNGGWYGQGGWKPQQPCAYLSILIEGAQNRLTSTWLCPGMAKAQGRHWGTSEGVTSTSSVNLPFKKADVFRKILKNQTQTA